MAAANGSSIFPLIFPTQPIPAEFLMDAYVQLIELINTQCAPNGQSITTPLTVFDSQFTIEDEVDNTKKFIWQLSGLGAGATITLAPNNSGNALFIFPAASDVLVGRADIATLTNKTLTNPVINGPAPVAAGATLALTAANAGAPILLNTAAGSAVTLPAATGSGNVFKFFVSATTTSGAHKILAASVSDFLNGIVTGENASTAKCFASAAATNHSLQLPFSGSQPSGGFIGDWFEFIDIAANLWTVKGMYQAGTTPTTPFSTATS